MSPEELRDRQRVLFVGGFTRREGAVAGGQVQACTSLLTSGITRNFEFIKIDSTMRSLPPPPVPVRAWFALRRIASFVVALMVRRPHAVLIFSSDHRLSIVEKGLMALIAKLAGRRVVISLRTEIENSSGIYGRFRRRALGCADVIVCQSEQAASRLSEQLDGPRLEVIPNWIEIPRSGMRVTRDTGQVNFLFVGWLERTKGIYELAEAFERLAREQDDVVLHVAGSGSEAAGIRSRLANLVASGHVNFHGWVDAEQRLELYLLADALVLPTYSEGMPNVVLEAMSHGIPVVSTTVGGIPDLIQDGVEGFLVEPRDHESLYDRMRRLAADPILRTTMGEGGRRRAIIRHDLDTAATRFADLLRRR